MEMDIFVEVTPSITSTTTATAAGAATTMETHSISILIRLSYT